MLVAEEMNGTSGRGDSNNRLPDGDIAEMTYQNPLTPHELIEFAALDVYSLLDADEVDHYARSLRFAPDVVREQVLECQAEIASDLSFLPDDEPGVLLRDRVLTRVAEAVKNDSRFQPVGRIGKNEGGATQDNGRPSLVRSAIFWRAAALVFLTVGLVFAYFWNDTYEYSKVLAQTALMSDASGKLKKLIGDGFEDFARGPNTHAVVFRPTTNDFPGQAVIYLKENTGQAFVVGLALPETPGKQYTLRMVESNGKTTDFSDGFMADGLYAVLRVGGISAKVMANAVFEIVGPGGGVVLTTAIT